MLIGAAGPIIADVEVGDEVAVVGAILIIVDVDVGDELAVVLVVVDTADCFRFNCFLFFARLFWNQILICLSDNCKRWAISCFLGIAMYSFNLNSFSNSIR
jgi:hypothetical protein